MKAAPIDELQRLIAESRATAVGLAAHHLPGGEEILIGADRPFHPASVFKICVMAEIFRLRRLGYVSLDAPVELRNEFRSIADGSLFTLDVQDDSDAEIYDWIGRSLPRGELVRRMITVSSNLATNTLMNDATPERIMEFMRELGLPDLRSLRGVEDNAAYRLGLNNSATARGMMQLLLKLVKGDVVSPQDSQEMVAILLGQQFNDMIPALLPAGVRVAHKTGWTADYHHDAGIVFPIRGDPFVLTIFTKGYAEAEDAGAHRLVASLAQTVYAAWCDG